MWLLAGPYMPREKRPVMWHIRSQWTHFEHRDVSDSSAEVSFGHLQINVRRVSLNRSSRESFTWHVNWRFDLTPSCLRDFWEFEIDPIILHAKYARGLRTCVFNQSRCWNIDFWMPWILRPSYGRCGMVYIKNTSIHFLFFFYLVYPLFETALQILRYSIANKCTCNLNHLSYVIPSVIFQNMLEIKKSSCEIKRI